MSQEVHIVVEGQEDSNFLQSYVGYLGYGLVEIKPIDGKGNFGGYCTRIAIKLDEGKRVLVVFDADDNYRKTRSQIRKTFQNKTRKDSENSDLDFFLFPNDKDSGNLEDLLERTIKSEHKGIFGCFEAYKECLTERDPSYLHPDKKAKIYAYEEALGAKKKGKDHDFSPNYWDFENSSLDPLKYFLCENFRKSGLEKIR